MKVLIDIGHPAHVHLFKNLARELENGGHSCVFTARDKEMAVYLLRTYGFSSYNLGKPYRSRAGKLLGLGSFGFKMLRCLLRERPDLLVSHGSMYAAQAGWMTGRPHISVEDTENSIDQIRLYRPFTKAILTGRHFLLDLGPKQLRFDGYHELAYLHPRRFTPHHAVLQELGVEESTPYVILRFVSRHASHDVGHTGISLENKVRAAREFSRFARVFVSSEAPLPPELAGYQIKIPAESMHDALAFAALVFGESATMASEAAMLGTPAIFVDRDGRGYTTEQERAFGLVFNFGESEADQQGAIARGLEVLGMGDAKEVWTQRRNRMLTAKIDVTAFLYWFVTHFRRSLDECRERNAEVMARFR